MYVVFAYTILLDEVITGYRGHFTPKYFTDQKLNRLKSPTCDKQLETVTKDFVWAQREWSAEINSFRNYAS